MRWIIYRLDLPVVAGLAISPVTKVVAYYHPLIII
jgi:hypothetical protein